MDNGLAIINLILFFLVLAYALYLFVQIIYARYLYIKLGREVDVEKELDQRLRAILTQVFGHSKLFKDLKSGLMHLVMFYGFIILQFGAIDLIGKGLSGNPYWLKELIFGNAYGAFVFMQEVTVVLILLAAAYAFYRRFIEKLPRLKRDFKSSLVIIFLFTLMLTVLGSLTFEAVALYHQGILSGYTLAQPITSFLAPVLSGLSQGAAHTLFYIFWWAHNLVLFSFLLYVPQSKHFHLIMAPINIFLKRLGPPAKLAPVNFEDESAEEFGVGRIEHFTRKQLMDLYACVECGRCTSVCPAAGTGKMLSPMDLIVKLRDHLTEKGAALTAKSPWQPAFAFSHTTANQLARAAAITQSGSETESGSEVAAASRLEETAMVGEIITPAELWACTTCRNCEEICPVGNEHVDKIVDMRRYLVLTQGEMPTEASRVFTNIERQSNPWGLNRKDRMAWLEDLEEGITVPTVKEVEQFDYLWFVGSMASYDARNQKVARAFAKILNQAGVSFAILGAEEKNSGDTARRLGNEYLFQELCLENIALFEQYNVKRIVTTDPHAYNILKNEYPDFGLKAEVIHHTELIDQLIREGKLKLSKAINQRITYHDSCYLGRYNGLYDVPRRILKAIPGVELAEMERNRDMGLCCGAGGGLMWLEEEDGKRINLARTEQAIAVQPNIIASACPYCLTMMSDGTKMLEVEEEIATKDIAELVAEAI